MIGRESSITLFSQVSNSSVEGVRARFELGTRWVCAPEIGGGFCAFETRLSRGSRSRMTGDSMQYGTHRVNTLS